MTTPPLSKPKRLICWFLTLLFVVLIALYIVMPTVMAIAALQPQPAIALPAPDGFTDVTLQTADHIRLAAWAAETQNGAAIVLVHGAGSGRDSVRELAALLHTQGYGVLALNLRGYGDSSGSINRLGWASRPDIGAAIEFLQSSPGVEHIGAMGLSMGGELLLGAASTYPEISAVVTEGATFRSVNDYVALPANQPLVRNFTQHVFSFVVQLLSGTPPPTPTLIDSIQAAERTHFLLIAAGTLQTEIEYNQLYQQTAADRSELWIIADAGHTGGYALDPAAYEARVIGFFDQTLSPQPLAPFP